MPVHRNHPLELAQQQALLNIPKHNGGALMTSDDPDEFPNELFTYTPRVGGHAPLAAFMEAL